ncbi:MAG: glycosyltransferase family 39 protein [Patescibacteria group bacterium]
MLQKLKNNQIVILGIIAIIFFFIYSFLIFGNSASKFTWPDETANYFFIKNYIQHSNFSVAEPLNEVGGDLIKPRSFNVYNHNLVPGSFLGMLLIYGLIGKVVGAGLVKFLTPLLAVLAGLFFYKILLKIFEPKIAFFSALLFYLNPAWWYYADLSMLPNISFLSFVIIGLYFLLQLDKEIKKKNWLWAILGSFFIALALIIRTNEFVWILAALIFLAVVYYKKLKWQDVGLCILVCILVFLPILYYNNLTYGSYFSFGYLRLSQGSTIFAQVPTEFKVSDSGILNFVKFIFLPFGFHPKVILVNLYRYVYELFWWLFFTSVLGGFIFLKKYHEKKHAVYFVLSLCVGLYLLAYYGSWVFADQLTLALNKIGISYVRYFLPIYILSLPLASIFIAWLINLFKSKKLKIALAMFLTSVFIGLTINVVYSAGYDNLLAVKQNISDYNNINNKVMALTGANSVIISQRSDKIFFPERKVIGAWTIDDFDNWTKLLDANVPLYYYATESVAFLEQLDAELYEYGVELTNETQIEGENYLYKIDYINYDFLDYAE